MVLRFVATMPLKYRFCCWSIPVFGAESCVDWSGRILILRTAYSVCGGTLYICPNVESMKIRRKHWGYSGLSKCLQTVSRCSKSIGRGRDRNGSRRATSGSTIIPCSHSGMAWCIASAHRVEEGEKRKKVRNSAINNKQILGKIKAQKSKEKPPFRSK